MSAVDPAVQRADEPHGVGTCTRCGMCQQACPTYRILRVEADSPRGRVNTIERIAAGEQPDAAAAEHLYACLGCRACETACPSGVPYGELLEYGRAQVERAGTIVPGRRGWRLFRTIVFEWVLPSRALFALAIAPARMLAHAPALARVLAALPSPMLARLLAMLPRDAATVDGASTAVAPAIGTRRARVAVFTGCVMGALFGGVHAALMRVLRRCGCEVVVPSGQWCCGALNLHAGERRHALEMARRNVVAFERADVEFIVVDSAGCGAELKSYGTLLAGDAVYHARAAAIAAKVVDASEYLARIGVPMHHASSAKRVTYQDACHLAHGQRVREAPRSLLRAIPGLEFVDMREADRCCGAAGVYSLTHPDMSRRILDEKMECVLETGADTVVVTNPGCHMQLNAALAQRPGVRVRHLVELLDEASAGEARVLPADN